MRQRFNEELQQYLWSKYPFEFKFSPSKEHTFWTLYKQKEDFRPEVDKSLSHMATLSNYPFFWYNLGCSIDDAFKYSATKGYKVCQWCEKIYHLDTRYKSCCSEECYKQNRLRGNARLSESKLKYNSRDPKQYAIRHNISVEEAAAIVDDFVNGGSVRRKEYWTKRGYTEEEAILKVSEVQSRCSARCIVTGKKEDILLRKRRPKYQKFKEKHVCTITIMLLKKFTSKIVLGVLIFGSNVDILYLKANV